ncbi:MAG: aminotransferase class V-fold PLP-dependent enzyme [Abitibacteriaceae bacterium]|nr:aminotransferase class V-fold PLP-dependent enzyme [Abditibacteriaceae bacterium]
MNFVELTRDAAAFSEWRRRVFPFFEHKICLTHASVSPLPRQVSQAIVNYAELIAREGQFEPAHETTYKECKERLARLIGYGAAPDEVAFASSTSHALGMVATGLDWQTGDNCIVADGDFPANVITWKNLTHTHGVEVRMIPHRPAMNITLDDVAALVDERTRIASLASANFLSGYPVDLAAIGAWLHERGILFCVDAIQTLGAIRLNAEHVDFICADAHKWLLGPNGIAVLWARRGVLEKMRPAIFGWLAPQNRDDWFAYDTTPIDSAERFEAGSRNYLGIVGFHAALELLQDVGAEIIEDRVTHLRNYAAQKLRKQGCRLLWNTDPALHAGIVTFYPPSGDATVLYNKLDEHFALALRTDKNGTPCIRVSPHFMNTEEDIDKLASAISHA